MQVWTLAISGVTGVADDLPLAYFLPLGHCELVHMQVAGAVTSLVIDLNEPAGELIPGGSNDRTRKAGAYGCRFRHGYVNRTVQIPTAGNRKSR